MIIYLMFEPIKSTDLVFLDILCWNTQKRNTEATGALKIRVVLNNLRYIRAEDPNHLPVYLINSKSFKNTQKVAAIKWLHHFMGHFGADNTQVTLAGCSAGGGSQTRSKI